MSCQNQHWLGPGHSQQWDNAVKSLTDFFFLQKDTFEEEARINICFYIGKLPGNKITREMTLISKAANFSCLCRTAGTCEQPARAAGGEACAFPSAAARRSGHSAGGAPSARACGNPRGAARPRSDPGRGRTAPAAVASGCPALDSCHAATPQVLSLGAPNDWSQMPMPLLRSFPLGGEISYPHPQAHL